MSIKDIIVRLIEELQENPNHDIEEIKELITDTFEEEIRAVSKQFIHLCHVLTESLVQSKRSVSGIELLHKAITNYRQHKSQLTPLHSDFCLLCLDAKCLNPALELLELDYTDIRKTEDRDEDVKRVLLFYYYGGLIYIAMKNYQRAAYYFEVVLTMPATVMNQIMQETYKKFILINVLISGKLQDNILPKYTSQCVMRQRKQFSQPYSKFAQEFTSLNLEKIKRFVSAHTSTFEKDDNTALVNLCLSQVNKKNVQRLTKTYLTLPLKDVANHVGLANEKEAELYVLSMIDDGDISATIDQQNGMVIFPDETEKFDSVSVFQSLQEDMSLTMGLIETLKKLESESGPSSS